MTEAIALDFPSFTGAAGATSRLDTTLLLVGVNHRTAPVAVRERLSVAEGMLGDAAAAIMRIAGVEGACILSTCNRVEVLVSATGDSYEGIVEWLVAHSRTPREAIEPHLYVRRDHAAAEHLFRLTAGLDSMILGEPQIAGQVKKAFAAGAPDAPLRRLFEHAMRAAKKVRSQTGIGSRAVSVPFAAVELAKKIFGDLSELGVLIVGAGEMAELTASHFAAQHVRQVFVANKTWQRAVELAGRFGGAAVPFSDLGEQLADCDIVVASTSAPHFVIDAAQVQRAIAARGQRPLFLIDLAVPRNVDPVIENLEGAYLYDIDDLQDVVDANVALRRCEAARAEQLVAAEARAFAARAAAGEAAPTIVALRSHVEAIRASELEKCLRRLGPMSVEQRAALEQLTVQLANKILHQPIVELRRNAPVRDAVRTIFGLQS